MTDERITDFTTSIPGADWFDQMASAWMREGFGDDHDPWSGFAGGAQRIAVCPLLRRPTGGGANSYVVDDSMDWRQRLVSFRWARVNPQNGSGFSAGFSSGFGGVDNIGGPGWPGLTDVSYQDSPGARLMFTADGVIPGTLLLNDAHCEIDPEVRVYARDTDGALMVDVTLLYAQDALSLVLMLEATEFLADGQAYHPTSVPEVTDGEPVYAGQLNELQDPILMSQAMEPDVVLEADPAHPVGSMPLGPRAAGPAPELPLEFVVSDRSGQGLAAGRKIRRRQRLAGGGRQIVFATVAPNGADTLVDASHDWSDRFASFDGVWSASDIRPGEAGDTGYSSGTPFQTAVYTYSGLAAGARSDTKHSVPVDGSDVVLYVGLDGGLYVRNDAGGTRYLAGMLIASPKLGLAPKE
jgi:hypothetical protein